MQKLEGKRKAEPMNYKKKEIPMYALIGILFALLWILLHALGY